MSEPMPSVITAQPARLLVGDREIAVPSQPLAQASHNQRAVELLTDNPDFFVLAPLPTSRFINVGTCFLAALMLGLGGWIVVLGLSFISILQLGGMIMGIVLLASGLIPVGFGCLIVHSILRDEGPWRFHFDHGSGKLLIDCRRGLSKQHRIVSSRALTDVLAVQLLYGGYHRISHTSDSGTSSNEQYYAYEMNLIVDDAEQPRLHLCGHADWQWMRDVGNTLSDFLHVPVVDQLHHGDGTNLA